MQARTETEQLWRTARTLGPRGGGRKLPPLLFFTDPARVPDPVAVAARLPRGAGVVYRAFGRADAVETGLALARVARRRGLVLLAGADPDLARRISAQGVHLPERALRPVRRRAGWIVTGAVHGRRGLVCAARLGLDAAILSPVFESRSPSAGRPLGPVRFAALVRDARLPVYGLGGVRGANARRLVGAGAAGLAAVDGVGEGGPGP